MEPRRPRPDELDAIVELIHQEQNQTSRHIVYVGTDLSGIRAELEDLTPRWTETARVVSAEGSIAGAALVEIDEAVARAWVYGPWVAGGDAAWAEHAPALLAAAIGQLPADLDDVEVAGHVDNVRLASLAEGLGWHQGVLNHVLVADQPTISNWPDATGHDLRAVQPGDADGITPLHDREFPGTYVTADQLVARSLNGDVVTLVSTQPGVGIVAYASGQVHADGEGFVDFLAIDPSWQRRGIGRALLIALVRTLLPDAAQERVCLMVQDPRIAARALYEELGFRPDGSYVGYRSRDAR